MKEYLPIGSVVLLKEGKKTYDIWKKTSRPATDKCGIIACMYPEGNINEDYMFLFNHEDIEKVVYRGYSDVEEEKFLKILNMIK